MNIYIWVLRFCVLQTEYYSCKTDEDCHKYYGSILAHGE